MSDEPLRFADETLRATDEPADAATRAVLAALGLARMPFPQTPDAENWFQTAELEREMAEASHCLLARKGFVLLTGEVGQGKTTFLRRLLQSVEREGARSSLIFNTFLQGPDLLAAVLRDFGLRPGMDAAANIAKLNRFLLGCWREGRTCVLFIDDAQNLDVASLELLRLLTNLESGQEKLLQIVLAGQPELEQTLQQHGLRQLASRIVKHVRLKPLDAAELAQYVAFRLARAGDTGRIHMAARAGAALHRDSSGNPRRVHLIMDRCLYGVIASGRPHIDAALVRRASSEAGVARRRGLPRRALAITSAALVVIAGLAAAASLGDRAAAEVAAPEAAAPVAARSNAGAAASGAATPVGIATPAFTHCLARAARGTDASGHGMQVFRVAEHLAPRFAGRHDVCLERRDGTTLVAWAPPVPLDQLAFGSRSEAVRDVQAQLLAVGAFDAKAAHGDPRDGHFGPVTRAALTRFQETHRLPATGRTDPLTMLLLEVASAHPGQAAARPENLHVSG